MLFADHVTVTPVCAPDASTSDCGNADVEPVAVFQFEIGTTPAVSDASIGIGLVPANLMPMGPAPAPVALTFSATGVAVRTRGRLVPVTVSKDDDAGAPLAIVTVIVDVPGPIRNDGLKEIVALAGWPLALRSTRSVKPSSLPIVTRNVAAPPDGISRTLGVSR